MEDERQPGETRVPWKASEPCNWESTKGRERAETADSITIAERAMPQKSTMGCERARTVESTASRERAKPQESTIEKERANALESTTQGERAKGE